MTITLTPRFELGQVVNHPKLGDVKITAWERTELDSQRTVESYRVVLTNLPVDPFGKPYTREFMVSPSELTPY